MVEYAVPPTDPDFPDAKFMLEYNGFGDLWGIPGACVDFDTGEEVPCGPGTRWVPKFNIPSASTVTENATEYVVKQLEMELRMKPANPADETDVSDCTGAGLTFNTSITLPTSIPVDWSDPFGQIGNRPSTSGVAVVGGELQQ